MARFRIPKNNPDSYNLRLYQDDHVRDNHILVILQTVDARDLEEGTLLSREVMPTFQNALRYARVLAKRADNNVEPFSITVINFNNYAHLTTKSPQLRRQAEQEFAHRVQDIIQKVNPSKILISGDTAAEMLCPTIPNITLKRGWVHNVQYGELTIPTVNTIDFSRLIDRGGLHGNLLGFWTQHFANLILGYCPYAIDVKVNPRYIDTDAKFKRLLGMLRKTERVAIDTETRSLGIHGNKIYMIQFCFEEDPDNQYIVPLRHPMSPLTTKQQRSWSKQLHLFFRGCRTFFRKPYEGQAHKWSRVQIVCERDELPELIFFNGSFDLRIIRTTLKVGLIPHPVWEIRAGEHLLDENASDLKYFGTRSGGLAYVTAYYGSDFYMKASFSKEERNTCGAVQPNDEGLLRYCGADVAHLVQVRYAQIKRASLQRIAGTRDYTKYFMRHMRHIMGETEQHLSRLRQDGSHVDLDYIKLLVSDRSPLLLEMSNLMKELMSYDSVKEANRQLLAEYGHQTQGLWGSSTDTTILKLSKSDHQIKLFIDILNLEPLTYTDTGKPQIDKDFIDEYRTSVPEVDTFGQYRELEKLYSTYVKGWLKRLRTTVDGSKDQALRPDYSYMSVATGRLASYDPSLQVVPTRGRSAPIIKQTFVCEVGRLIIDFDFSANEVRFWSIVANDQVLAEAFRVGQKLRQQWIVNPTEENAKAIKEHGDLHLSNVKRFFNRVVERSHPLRDAVKAVVFGAIYGMSAESLGNDTKLPEIRDLKSKITTERDSPKPNWDLIQTLESKVREIIAEDRTEFAQDILNRMFREFAKGAQWLDRMKEMAVKHQQVYAPSGRIRHLYATLIDDVTAVNRQLRRGVNAPIQGIGSEYGTVSARNIDRTFYNDLPIYEKALTTKIDHIKNNRIVHDASYYMAQYEAVIPLIHIINHMATYGTVEYMDKNLGINFTVEPEIEIAIGATGAKMYEWNWSLNNLMDCIKKAINDAEELGRLEGTKDEALERTLQPWKHRGLRDYLHNQYPLLGVPEAVNNVPEAIKYAYSN